MKAIFGVFSFLLCASFVIFLPAHASAQSGGASACVLAGTNTPNISRQFTSGPRSVLQQVMQDKRYLKCLQSHGQLPTSGATAAAKGGTFITFDVPGSTCLASFPFCTRPSAINPAGAITGFYADANGGGHSFLRTPGGTITNIDPPGSGGSGTSGINPAGVITGIYCDATACHGFLRSQSGAFTTFDPKGSLITQPNGINPAGAIVGYYQDVNFVAHGFLRATDGTFTTFDAPGSSASGGGTFALGINSAGVIMGSYLDANSVQHGFLRTGYGTFTTFDPTGSTYTNPTAINPEGRSRDNTVTPSPVMASCALATAPSPRSIHQAPITPRPTPSTRQGRSRDCTNLGSTVSCAPATVPSPYSMSQAPNTHGALPESPQRGRSRDRT
jgi:hypothetical protein